MNHATADQESPARDQHHQFRDIMVATDLSALSLKGLQVAVACAQKLGAALHIVHVVTPDAHAADVSLALATRAALARESLREWTDHPLLAGVKYSQAVLVGSLIGELRRYVNDRSIDLVVIDGGSPEKGLMGSAAESIVQNLHCPVVIAGPSVKPTGLTCRSIVLATSLACPTSMRAAKYAVGLAEKLDAHLTLVHIEVPGDLRRIDKAARDSINRQLNNLLPPVCDCWCRPKVHFLNGDPAIQILLSADKEGADMIVMSALDDDLILGDHSSSSVLAKVVRGAKCPVMAVRAQPMTADARFG